MYDTEYLMNNQSFKNYGKIIKKSRILLEQVSMFTGIKRKKKDTFYEDDNWFGVFIDKRNKMFSDLTYFRWQKQINLISARNKSQKNKTKS